ncbi:hypothetical protein RHGRI_037417 [Rhododendron griersonianum]|uniref:Uncharacterized protein n=1 Tax=Rhododendron griersonianum TaxID=479676 RepID=A0AAV6HRM5_9ERIC|nr:hypothetical protein RHGRI_037417 [Rhododendron griersonianum]
MRVFASCSPDSNAQHRPWLELANHTAFSLPDTLAVASSHIRKNASYFRHARLLDPLPPVLSPHARLPPCRLAPTPHLHLRPHPLQPRVTAPVRRACLGFQRT